MTLADTVVVLNKGRVQQIGPLEVYDRPANTFVATFLGSPPMNLLPARLAADPAAGAVLDAGSLQVPLPNGLAAPPPELLPGFRPEAVEVGPAGSLPHTAELKLVERLGSPDVVYLAVGGATIVAITPSRAVSAAPHAPLGFHVPPEAVHLFDGASGARLASPASLPRLAVPHAAVSGQC